jgi:hypothetical protein
LWLLRFSFGLDDADRLLPFFLILYQVLLDDELLDDDEPNEDEDDGALLTFLLLKVTIGPDDNANNDLSTDMLTLFLPIFGSDFDAHGEHDSKEDDDEEEDEEEDEDDGLLTFFFLAYFIVVFLHPLILLSLHVKTLTYYTY